MATLKQIKTPDYTVVIKINKIFADNDSVKFYYNSFKNNSAENTKEEEIWRNINNLIVRDNVFNRAMGLIASCYEFDIAPSEIKQLAETIRKQTPHLASAPDIYLNTIATRSIEKDLMFADLAKAWNITVSDDETKKALEYYYHKTNKSIHDLLNDKAKFEEIRKQLLSEKITEAVCSKFKVEFDWDAIKSQNSEISQKQDDVKSSHLEE